MKPCALGTGQFTNEDRDLSKGGRPPFNRLILFKALDAAWVFANEGKMVDASFVKVPRQRNTREENKHIKETGTAPHEWKVKPHKLAQKDVDARWTKKNNATFYGYKNHVKVDTQ